ncbi:MAG: hypothetical protein ACH37Z_11420 [Anaerolineae bacterium]
MHHEALNPPGARGEDNGWRLKKLSRSSQDERRDICPARREWVLRIAHWLWATNPVAKRGIQNTRSLVASEGFKIRATSEDPCARHLLQDQLDMHWELAGWDEHLSARVETLGVEGEWAYWLNPVNTNGHIEIAKVMPENIDSILRDPKNAERLEKMILSEPLEFDCGGQVVRKNELSLARRNPWTGEWSGEALYLGLNQLSGQTRGWSDLLVVCDWLDILDQLLYTETERVQFQRAMVFDYLVKGDSEAVQKRIAQLRADGPPKPGSMNVRNEGEELNILSPDLKLNDSVGFIKFVMLICFGGLNMPEHWFSSGGDVNKATAAEMGTPLWALVRDRKRQVKGFIEQGAAIAMQRVRCAGGFAGICPSQLTWEVTSRDPDRTAYDLVGGMLGDLGDALAMGVQSNWVSEQEAAGIFRSSVQRLGLGDLPAVTGLDGAQRAAVDALERQKPALSLVTPLALDTPSCQQCKGPINPERHTTGVCSWCQSRNRRNAAA